GHHAEPNSLGFEDDYPGVFRPFAYLKIKEFMEIDDRQKLSTHVDYSQHERRRAGDRGQISERINFAHVWRLERISFVSEHELNHLEAFTFGVALGFTRQQPGSLREDESDLLVSEL